MRALEVVESRGTREGRLPSHYVQILEMVLRTTKHHRFLLDYCRDNAYENSIPSDHRLYCTIVRGYVDRRLPEDALETFIDAERRLGDFPAQDRVQLALALLTSARDTGRPDIAQRAKDIAPPEVARSVTASRAIAEAAVLAGEWSKGLSLVQEGRGEVDCLGLFETSKSDVGTFKPAALERFVEAAGLEGQWHHALVAYHRLQRQSPQSAANPALRQCIMEGLARAGRWVDSLRVAHQQVEKGERVTTTEVSLLLATMHAGGASAADVVKVFDQLVLLDDDVFDLLRKETAELLCSATCATGDWQRALMFARIVSRKPPKSLKRLHRLVTEVQATTPVQLSVEKLFPMLSSPNKPLLVAALQDNRSAIRPGRQHYFGHRTSYFDSDYSTIVAKASQQSKFVGNPDADPRAAPCGTEDYSTGWGGLGYHNKKVFFLERGRRGIANPHGLQPKLMNLSPTRSWSPAFNSAIASTRLAHTFKYAGNHFAGSSDDSD